MKTRRYSRFGGINLGVDPFDLQQVESLRTHNFINNRVLHRFFRRGGSQYYSLAANSNILGLAYYRKEGTSLSIPETSLVIRHRRVGATSYIEKFDWSAGTWSAITQGANASFSDGAIASFCQIDHCFLLCAGKPAFMDSPTGAINSLGGPAPTAAPTIAVGAAGALTGTYGYYYTFYNNTTGWESSPSPITTLLSVTAQKIDLSSLETTCAKEGVGHKRIYRTVSTGEQPHLFVAQVTLASTTYTDNIADSSLGLPSHNYDGVTLNWNGNPPPSTSFLCAAHEGRFWIASGPELYYSEAYDGTNKVLERFSYDRLFSFPGIITGILSYKPGSLLVFLSPGSGVYEVFGNSDETFGKNLSIPDEGTFYHKSVSSYGKYVTWWGTDGPRLLGPQGLVDDYGGKVREMFRDALLSDYDGSAYVWSVWHTGSRQFIYGIAFSDSDGAMWADYSTGAPVPWFDAGTGARTPWEI